MPGVCDLLALFLTSLLYHVMDNFTILSNLQVLYMLTIHIIRHGANCDIQKFLIASTISEHTLGFCRYCVWKCTCYNSLVLMLVSSTCLVNVAIHFHTCTSMCSIYCSYIIDACNVILILVSVAHFRYECGTYSRWVWLVF